jgi:hypothetical protein
MATKPFRFALVGRAMTSKKSSEEVACGAFRLCQPPLALTSGTGDVQAFTAAWSTSQSAGVVDATASKPNMANE